MSNVTIDLSPVVDRVNAVVRLAEHVSQQVETVSRQHQDTRNALDQLVIDFRAFVAADILAKEFQRAETKIISVRQEIDKKFGHYDVVRRRATGIMQATDRALVRQETMQVAGEQTMLDAPRYWLAPALVALTAWITDNSTLARRAVTEAMRRDDSKTTLFMTLVCRRFGRQAAVDIWLKRYFQQQTPFALDREAVTLLDAMTNGVFGVGATAQCVGVLQQWLADQVQQVGFFNEQRKRWAEAMVAMTPGIELNGYPTLASYGKNWQTLSHCLAEARLSQRLIQHFSLILDHEIVHQERLTDAVDDILMSLVANFDDEELVLRREERALQLIVEKMGDVSAARITASLENKTLDEKMSFAQLLTNAVMFPEQSKATLATRKLALGMSREWIEPAFADVIAASRARVPTGVDLVIHDWTATTTYGDDEKALVASFDKEMKRRTDKQLALIKDNHTPLVVGGLLALGSLALHWLLFFLIAGVGFYLWWAGRTNNIAKRNKIRTMNNEKLIDGNRIISAACAEGVDFRRQLAAEDAKASQVTALLNRISPESAIFARAGSGRAVLN